jgi:hypothetical protein
MRRVKEHKGDDSESLISVPIIHVYVYEDHCDPPNEEIRSPDPKLTELPRWILLLHTTFGWWGGGNGAGEGSLELGSPGCRRVD